MPTTGTLYIISAPSGGGKTTLVNALIQTLPNIIVSISYTTRPMRPGEQDNVDYHFVSPKKFQSMLSANEFLEHAKVFDHDYGTSQQWVNDQLERGMDVILEIDWQGAQQIRQIMPHCVSIFILPPSTEILLERLRARGQDNETVIRRRMAKSNIEISHYHEYDYLIINDHFESALMELIAIVRAERLLQANQAIKQADLIAKLLAVLV